MLARLDGELVVVAEGPVLVRTRGVRNAKEVVAHLRGHGVLDRATLEQHVKLDALPIVLDARTIASAHHDLRALSQPPALALAREHRRALARHGTIDEAWLERKRKRLEHLAEVSRTARDLGRPRERWFDSVVELVRAMRGEREASLLADAATRLRARAGERRDEARARVDALVSSLRSGVLPSDPELAQLAERLDAARELPGRARRRRVLDVLRRAVAWLDAPADLVSIDLGAQEIAGDFSALVEASGHAMASSLPALRDPSLRDQSLELLAHLGLVFALGDDGVPLFEEHDVAALLEKIAEIVELAPSGMSLAKALALYRIPMKRPVRLRIARWVAEGLELELVAESAEKKQLDNLARVPDVRSARAYATWATRLSTHYEARGISFSLSPELFTNLPRNEDLAVLAMCLMEHVDPKLEAKTGTTDPIAVLDSTLALFQKLPAKAKTILASLRGTDAGEGRRCHPDFARWIDDDVLLDRLLHVARLAGEPPLSSAIREDFEHAERTRGERAHLEALPTRSAPQQGRLDVLLRAERTLEGSPKGRTRRRIAERIERLLPAAYRRELDGTFRELLREVWGISVPSLTPAWRDAVRFWLVVDENRTLLGRLLETASNTPRRDTKRSFPPNLAWIESARQRMNVDAWLAPRRKEIRVARPSADGNVRFVLELEEDPLEVLRMGIPFGTCLALDSGCNAASTVLNAIEANKRVLYVRNASGNVVARKLLAISKDGRLVGYNLYVSASGVEEIAIRAAVLELCHELARDAGVELASTGTPAQLHEGFWYDDGTVPFDEDVDAAAYCKSLGLPPPPKWFEELGKEARAWRARETGDVEAAITLLASYDTGAANRGHGRWVVEHLGRRSLMKHASEDPSVFVALTRAFADEGEYGMIRALDLAGRVPEGMTHHRIAPLLARFPPSPKLAVALVDLGLRTLKRGRRTTKFGLAHLTLYELPPMFDDVAGSFDLLDSVEPVWEHVKRELPSCDTCVRWALARSADIVERNFERAPDPDVVVATLMSRHRSAFAQRVALRVAARHVLPDGDRALTRLISLRPELAASPDGIAAILRQAQVDRVTDALAQRLPAASAPPFEALRELLLRCENIEVLLGESARVADIDGWQPGPWELAWRRRRQDPELGDGLFARAARSPRTVTRAMDLLALLGDLRRIDALDHVQPKAVMRADPNANKAKTSHESPEACRRTAASIAEQVEAEHRGRVDPDVTALPHADAAYVDLARRALLDDATDEASRDVARDVVLQCSDRFVVDWERLLERTLRDRGDTTTGRRILEEKITDWLSPRMVVEAWQHEPVRTALVRAFEVRPDGTWAARVWAAEREAQARGLSVEGLLERVALALSTLATRGDVVDAESFDQLRAIVVALTREAAPVDLARIYSQLPDTFSTTLLLRAVNREPVARRAELREAARKLDLSSDHGKALDVWLELTRPQRSWPPSTGREASATARD
jgi:hypothetical protein